MNTFGQALRLSTFGESHGLGIGAVLDGVPAGLAIDEIFIAKEMLRRAPGRNIYATPRKESDSVEILSGVFEGKSTGVPIGLWIGNTSNKSSDYNNIKDIFRPNHADFTYFKKYGLRDYRGGGRASARESTVRVAAGSHDSIGGVATICAFGLPVGLGEPLYHRLDGALGDALLGLNAVKAVEIGDGVKSSEQRGSMHNDKMNAHGFISNHSGGILGGISNGNILLLHVHFKPTPSIFIPQETLNISMQEVICKIKGRHDPCVAVRGSVVAEAMVALVLADMLLLNATSQLAFLKRIYGE